MPWSKADLSKSILRKDKAEKTVLEFTPPRFDLGTPNQALDYLKQIVRGSDFRMNDAIRLQTGVDKIEHSKDDEKIEVAALEKLKEIQEGAYQEAYNLGLEEGRNLAFQKQSKEISTRLDTMDALLSTIINLKEDLRAHNEAHLIRLVFQMATRLAKVEVTTNNESVVSVLKDAIRLAQDEENVTVRVSNDQFEFFEELKKNTGREFDFLKKIRFEPSADITAGGCIVETNYGEVDARVEQRIAQLWATLSENIPKVKDKIAG
jgi:flagellar assembly protein FliH